MSKGLANTLAITLAILAVVFLCIVPGCSYIIAVATGGV